MIGLSLLVSVASLPAGFSATPTGGTEVIIANRPVQPRAGSFTLAGLPRLYANEAAPAAACERLGRAVAASGARVVAVQRLDHNVVVLVVKPAKTERATPPAACRRMSRAVTWRPPVYC